MDAANQVTEEGNTRSAASAGNDTSIDGEGDPKDFFQAGLTMSIQTTEGQVQNPETKEAARQQALEEKFCRLANEWRTERGPHSSSAKLAMHPAYQKIIGMGQEAVPLILRELKSNLESWFWALSSITEQDPVPEQDRGNGKAMRAAWFEWGERQGYKI